MRVIHTPALGALFVALVLAGCPNSTGGNSPEPGPKSPDASLKSLVPGAGALDPAFDPAITEYTVTVPHDVAAITLSAETASETAVLSGPGAAPRPLEPGPDNYIGLRVVAENGTARTYTVQVIRDEGALRTASAGPYPHGVITAAPRRGLMGTPVSLAVTAAPGYILNPLSLKYTINGASAEYPIAPNTRSFTLPRGDVTVLAEFIGMEEFSLLTVPVAGAAVDRSPLGGETADYPFAPSKLPVTVSPFSIGAAEVSFWLYDTVRTWATDPGRGDRRYALGPPGQAGSNTSDRGPMQPVTQLSWTQIVVWCNACSDYAREVLGMAGFEPLYTTAGGIPVRTYLIADIEGLENWAELPAPEAGRKGFRLPTEAEWEFAARGGDPAGEAWDYPYAGGEDPDPLAWYQFNSKGNTHIVGSKLPNTLGIHDMGGNVNEHCWDPADSAGADRVARGFGYGGYGLISSRYGSSALGGGEAKGFRVVRQE